ncbi:hypothetical protein B0H19DRAFT_1175744 [Mycena capillaripes]|nr:hypothetical protein B0H19DRAFT_1175744 [Mycena capillaripes]
MSMSPPFPSSAFVLHVVPVLTTFCGLKGSIQTPTPDRYTFFSDQPIRRRLVGAAVSYTERQTSSWLREYSSCQASRQCSSGGKDRDS